MKKKKKKKKKENEEKTQQEVLIFAHIRLLANHSIFLIQHKEKGMARAIHNAYVSSNDR